MKSRQTHANSSLSGTSYVSVLEKYVLTLFFQKNIQTTPLV